MSEKVLKVLSNVAQGLTETQKAQARSNIGCAGAYTAGTGITINDHSIINTAPNVKSDWLAATGTSAEILNKPSIGNGTLTIQKNGTDVATFSANQSGNTTANITGVGGTDVVTRTNGQGGYVETSVSKLTLDTDFQQIIADNNQIGVYAPTPVIAVSDKVLTVTAGSDAPVWTDTPSNAEFIQFTYGNTTTAQDTVYTAVAAAYTAGKLPVLYCGVANATLYWFPTANGANGYSFARTVSNYSYVVTIDASTHVISHQSNEIINYTAGSNVQIDANNVISATDTTYTAGYGIEINNSNVISNTMHQDTYGLMISYNTLGNSGVTTHSIGPWRIQVTKAAMAAWDSTTNNYSLHIAFAHQDYLDDSIVNGRILVDTLTPWADGAFSTVYTGHNQWGFTGTYSQGGSNDGFGLQLISPDSDPDGYARACPKTMRAYHFTVNCGINGPDWLECDASLLYVNNNTSLTSNAARLLLRFKYFYV